MGFEPCLLPTKLSACLHGGQAVAAWDGLVDLMLLLSPPGMAEGVWVCAEAAPPCCPTLGAAYPQRM